MADNHPAGLAAEGARIVVADLARAEEAAAAYPDGVGLTVDVSREDEVARMVEETVGRCGGVDILVNNAGLYASLAMRPFTEIPLEEWNRVMEVNLASMFLACRAIVPIMRGQGGGKIVNISSGTPFRGVPFLLHYVTSKGAIVALTRSWARELAPSTELRRWFGHDPERFEEFQRRYREELAEHRDELEELRARAKSGRLTLVFGARDTEHNDAVVLAEILRGG